MSVSPGWDHPPPPAPGWARPPVDWSGEPVGYDLPALPVYEQPPPRPQPYLPPAPHTRAQVGLRLSLIALVPSVFIAPLPLAIVGMVVSSTALRRTVPGDVDRRRAIAGIITGILGILIPVLMIITLSSFGS